MAPWIISLIIISIYCIAVILIGIASRDKGVSTLENYYVGGRSIGPFVSYFTYVATFHSSFAFLGAAGQIYTNGINFFAVFTSCVVSPLMIYFIGRPVWYLGKKYNFMTQADLLSSYYESNVLRMIISVVSLIFLVPYLQSQIMGGGIIFETVTGGRVPYWAGTLIIYIVMISYILLGGFKAVAWTDTMQGLMMIFLVWIGGGVVLGKVTGTLDWSVLMNRVAQEVPEKLIIPVEYWPTYMTTFMSLFGISIYPPSFIRFYSVKNPKTLKWLAVTSPIYLIFFYVPIFLIAFSGILVMPGLERADMVLPAMLSSYAPPVLTGLIMAGALAATMSTADSQLHVTSSIFTIDIYKPFINKDATEERALFVGKIAIVVVSAIALLMSQFTNALLVAIVAVALGGCLQILPSLLGALYWKGITKEGAITGIIVGVVVLCITQFVIASPLGLHSGVWGLIFNVLSCIIVSRFTEAPSNEKVEMFHGYIREINEEQDRAKYGSVLPQTAETNL
ncbi:MAG: sodium:solute symporter family protein [Caldicoprobacterales bacterium]|jgi:SSS family solute:Na+ symporter